MLPREIGWDLEFISPVEEFPFDREAIRKVLINLLTNAYKYTSKVKEINVVVREEEDQVVVEVSDNGIGISQKDKSRIFQPFYRSGEEHREGASGAGLGLAIARKLVELHKGKITVESEIGKGSGGDFATAVYSDGIRKLSFSYRF